MKFHPLVLINACMVVLLIFVTVAISFSARAAPGSQGVTFATNTPLPDGRIMYKVQSGDTCIRLEYLYGISEVQLRQLNIKLDSNCTLVVGDLLLMGVGGPAANPTATPGPSPTPAPPTITPTPFHGTTQICVSLFNDLNGDGLHETTEPMIPGGAISVTETSGKYSKTLPTLAGTDPICFTDLPEGNYNISTAIPDNYNPTMALSY